MILNEKYAKALLEKVLAFSNADGVQVNLRGSDQTNIRFAVNTMSTNGFSDGLSLTISSRFGKKIGSVATNKFDDSSLNEAVKKSEEVVKFSPDSKEYVELLGPQTYNPFKNFSETTSKWFEGQKASDELNDVISASISNDVSSAGFLNNDISFNSILNSKGLFAYSMSSDSGFSITVRTKEGNGSSRVEKRYVNSDSIKVTELSNRAIDRSILSKNPEEISPGKYTVILEPAAVADMVSLGLNFMGARGADEGRSFFSVKDGGTMIGQEVVNSKVTIYTDPTDELAPSNTFTSEGFPRSKTVWFENGVLQNLHRDRYWAEKNNQTVIPYPSNIIMNGTEKSLEQMIAETENGILVTRFWYIRTVSPKQMLLTGLTRDGIFEIKNGKISRPVKNFRFNESPMNILKNVIDIGKAEKATGSENESMQMFVPVLKVANFNFSSLSDAI